VEYGFWMGPDMDTNNMFQCGFQWATSGALMGYINTVGTTQSTTYNTLSGFTFTTSDDYYLTMSFYRPFDLTLWHNFDPRRPSAAALSSTQGPWAVSLLDPFNNGGGGGNIALNGMTNFAAGLWQPGFTPASPRDIGWYVKSGRAGDIIKEFALYPAGLATGVPQ
jgi:hypothetical protein